MRSYTRTPVHCEINIKIKLAALWTSVVFCYLYGDYFELYTPNKVDSLITGTNVLDSPTKLLIASVTLAIPSIMVALSILLNPKVNRFLNVLFGIVFTLMMILIGVNSLTPWYGFYVFLAFLESIITFTNCVVRVELAEESSIAKIVVTPLFCRWFSKPEFIGPYYGNF